jgi:hypothetical protein
MHPADHSPTTAVPLPVTPRALVIPHVLEPAELDGLRRVGDALANISERLSAVMGQPGGPVAGELRDLATLAMELLDVVEPDPDLEPDADTELTANERQGAGFTAAGGFPDDAEDNGDDEENGDEEPDVNREPDTDDEASRQPPRLDAVLGGREAAHA